MARRRSGWWLLLFGMLLMAPSASRGGEPTATSGDVEGTSDEEKASYWMTQKLRFSQEILAGLARADFDAINKNAEAMKGLSRVELFVRARTPGYRTQMRAFEFATSELLRTSQRENLEGATLAFTQLSVSCVQCHKELRDPEKPGGSAKP